MNDRSEAQNRTRRLLPEESNSESSEKSRRRRWKPTERRLIIAESMLEQANMDDARVREQVSTDREER